MGMKSELRKRLSKAEGRLRREGRRLASVFLCGALIVGNLSAVPVSVLADSDSDNEYTYEIEKAALQAALQTAVSEGNTVNEDLEFAGEHAEEYAELLEADGTLYELELADDEIDEDDDRDKALDLRIFARIEGDIPLDETYEIDGSEEIVFLLSNKTDETVTATICVDELETEAITILPADSIPVDEEGTAVENVEAVTNAISSGISTGGAGGGGSSGSSAVTEEVTDGTEDEIEIAITDSVDEDETEGDSITEDSSVSIMDGDDSDDSISAEESDISVNDPADEEEISSDREEADDPAGDIEDGNTDTENKDTEDLESEEASSSKEDDSKADADENAGGSSEAAGDTSDTGNEGTDAGAETGDTGSAEGTDSSSGTSDGGDTSDAGNTDSGNTGDAESSDSGSAGDTSGSDSGSDITEDSDVSVLGSAISIHNSVLLAASIATDSDADETASPSDASPSDADKIIEGELYEAVRFEKYGAVAFATTSADLGLDQVVYVEYTAQSSDVTVTVTAPSTALPKGAELSVTLYDEDSEEYAAAAEAIDYTAEDTETLEDDVDYSEDTSEVVSEEITNETTTASTGLAVLDISFLVDGEEVEPTGTVTVSIDASGILPKDADMSTIEVQHLTETNGSVEPVLVADATDNTAGTVDTETAMAEFEVESFSTFTIQWSANNDDSEAITTTCYFSSDGEEYDENDNLIPSGISSNNWLWVGYSNEVDFDDDNSLLVVDGYTLDHANLNITTTTTTTTPGRPPTTSTSTETIENVASIRAVYDWDAKGWTYQYAIADEDDGSLTWTTISSDATVTLELYYNETEPELTGDLTITDDIVNTGSLVATYTGSEELTEGSYYYKWYKLNTDTGEYEEITGEIESSLAVYIDGARETYYVELIWTATNEVIATSNHYQVPYYDELLNGSFEDPSVSGTAQLTNGLYSELIWQTTGFGSDGTYGKGADGQDIEIVNATDAGSNYGETSAADGDQYAELNCESEGTLYQDVLTIPGVPLYWKLAHEGRTGTDSMCVIIVDAEFADKYITTQADVTAVYNEALAAGLTASEEGETSYGVTFDYTVDGETVSITVWLITTDNVDWAYYYGTYQVPEGQYLTRFLFGAVSTQSGNNTTGNLLDDVSFSQTPTTSEKSGNVTITKTVAGVDEDEVIPARTYTFTVNDVSGNVIGRVSLPTSDATASQTYYWTYTLTNITPANYNATEVVNNDLAGYKYLSTTSTPDGTTGTTSGNFTVFNESTSTVSFTNTYEKGSTSITLKKVDASSNELLNGAVFTLSSEGEEDRILTVTDGTLTVEDLVYGTVYTLTETNAPDGYNLLTEPIVFKINTDNTVTFISGSDFAEFSSGTEVEEDTEEPENENTENTDDPTEESIESIVITVKNTAGSELPETGGPGTLPFRIAGLLLTSCSAYLIYETLRRRRNYLSK